MEVNQRIAQLLEEKFTTDEAYADCFTVDIELRSGNRLYVFIDADSGIDFDKCHHISRYLESYLDTNGWLGDKYVLEVSSPGLSRPLKFVRQYVKNIGRHVAVVRTDKTEVTGLLKSADDQQIVVAYTIVEKEGKKKVEKAVEVPILYAEIEKTLVKVVF